MTYQTETTCVRAGCFHGKVAHAGMTDDCMVPGCECKKFSATRETMPSDKQREALELHPDEMFCDDIQDIARYKTFTGSRGGGKTEGQREAISKLVIPQPDFCPLCGAHDMERGQGENKDTEDGWFEEVEKLYHKLLLKSLVTK